MDLKTISLICPENDGEAKRIIEIADSLNIDVRKSSQGWGASIDKEPENNILDLNENVLIVEMPGEKMEKKLGENHNVFIIDHHKMFGLDRTNPKSSIEQFAELVNYDLSRRDMGLAYNDKGYIYLMMDNGYSADEMKEIREFDLEAQAESQNISWDSIKEMTKKSIDEIECKNNILFATIPTTFNMYLLDSIMLDYPEKIQNLLITTDVEGNVPLIQFFGRKKFVDMLYTEFGGFSGGSEAGFWGLKEGINVQKIKDFILKFDTSEEFCSQNM